MNGDRQLIELVLSATDGFVAIQTGVSIVDQITLVQMLNNRDKVLRALDEYEELPMSAADEAIERVRALHKVCTETPFDEGGCTDGCDEPICTYDAETWPCLTIKALDGGSDD